MVHCRVLGVGFRVVNLLSIWFQASGLWSIVHGLESIGIGFRVDGIEGLC